MVLYIVKTIYHKGPSHPSHLLQPVMVEVFFHDFCFLPLHWLGFWFESNLVQLCDAYPRENVGLLKMWKLFKKKFSVWHFLFGHKVRDCLFQSLRKNNQNHNRICKKMWLQLWPENQTRSVNTLIQITCVIFTQLVLLVKQDLSLVGLYLVP